MEKDQAAVCIMCVCVCVWRRVNERRKRHTSGARPTAWRRTNSSYRVVTRRGPILGVGAIKISKTYAGPFRDEDKRPAIAILSGSVDTIAVLVRA